MRFRKIAAAAALLAVSALAEAHGEEVVVSLFAQVIAVLGVILAVCVFRPLRRHAVAGVLGCFAGVALDWLATGDMPYWENHELITFLAFALPVLLSCAFVLLARRFGAKSDT